MKRNNLHIRKLILSALFLALGIALPFLTGQIPEIGSALCPMHIPVLLCGFICGWPWALAVGFITPLLRSFLFQMPPMFPGAFSMAFELATYGIVTGLMIKLLPKQTWSLYVSLFSAMLAGRIVWGLVRYILSFVSNVPFGLSLFISGAITTALPGILLQILLIPSILLLLKKANILYND